MLAWFALQYGMGADKAYCWISFVMLEWLPATVAVMSSLLFLVLASLRMFSPAHFS